MRCFSYNYFNFLGGIIDIVSIFCKSNQKNCVLILGKEWQLLTWTLVNFFAKLRHL